MNCGQEEHVCHGRHGIWSCVGRRRASSAGIDGASASAGASFGARAGASAGTGAGAEVPAPAPAQEAPAQEPAGGRRLAADSRQPNGRWPAAGVPRHLQPQNAQNILKFHPAAKSYYIFIKHIDFVTSRSKIHPDRVSLEMVKVRPSTVHDMVHHPGMSYFQDCYNLFFIIFLKNERFAML